MKTPVFLVALVCTSLMNLTQLLAQTIKVGTANTISDAPIFIADRKGYFRKEGLEVELIHFRSAADMMVPAAKGEIQVGAAAVSAGLFNAIAAGTKIKIVADKGTSIPRYGAFKILLRSDHIKSKPFDLRELNGKTFAVSDSEGSARYTLNLLIKSAGLDLTKIKLKTVPGRSHAAVLKNRSVDASVSVEPAVAQALKDDRVVLLKSDDQLIPNHQVAVLFYSQDFAQQWHEAARSFMRAYLRGVDFYKAALKHGKFRGPNKDEVVAILVEALFKELSDDAKTEKLALYKSIHPIGMNSDGRVDIQGLKRDLRFYRDSQLIHDRGALNLDDVIDNSFVEAERNKSDNTNAD
jgi:NitT/TauT family transport system substrate-binding protein